MFDNRVWLDYYSTEKRHRIIRFHWTLQFQRKSDSTETKNGLEVVFFISLCPHFCTFFGFFARQNRRSPQCKRLETPKGPEKKKEKLRRCNERRRRRVSTVSSYSVDFFLLNFLLVFVSYGGGGGSFSLLNFFFLLQRCVCNCSFFNAFSSCVFLFLGSTGFRLLAYWCNAHQKGRKKIRKKKKERKNEIE